MIDRSTIQRIMDAADIVEVVREFVTLRKAGVNYKGLCPFHHEKTPSFTVSPAKQLCKCFSCGKGGNAVNFLMQLEQMTYPEALKWLARKYGIEVREKELTDEEKAKQSERESLFALNDWANQYFQEQLHGNVDGVAIGMAYFRQRGFRDELIKKFQLGYALSQRDAITKAALQHGFKEEYLITTGLTYRSNENQLLDRFHGRVIFPVFTVSGKVVAFGGRILSSDKKLAKYVNSPESIIYSKSHELYGLFQAKNSIVRNDCCFLVEGYTDVISMHQAGIENVVASSGTSLTDGQIRLLHRFTNNITVLYDGDAAGIRASMRGIDMLLAEGMNIKVLPLPEGEDPDSFVRSHRPEEFQQYIEAHQIDFIKFKTNHLLEEAQRDPIKRAEMITDVVRSISVIPNQIVRQMYVSECAYMLGVSEALIINEINKQVSQTKQKGKKDNNVENPEDLPNQSASNQEATVVSSNLLEENSSAEEKLLIAMIIRYGNCPMNSNNADESDNDHIDTHEQQQLNVAQFIANEFVNDGMEFQSPLYQSILQEALEQSKTDNQWQALPYFVHHPNFAISKLAVELGEENFTLSSRQKEQYVDDVYRLEEIVPRLLHDYKHSIIKNYLKQILSQLRDPNLLSNPDEYKNLMRKYMEVSAIERKLAQILGDRVILK